MLKIAICDDQKIMRNDVKKCLDDYSFQRDLDIVYREFSTGLDFLRDKSHFDLVILDYRLSEDSQINGLAVAKKLRSHNKGVSIIFLTSYPKVVFSSFEVDTFRFLVKPLEPEKLFKALDDYLKTTDKNDIPLAVKLDGVNTVLNAKKIRYLEGQGKYSLIHTGDDKFECHELMSDLENRLPEDYFFRCHRSFVVNMKYVTAYDSTQIFLRGGQTVPVSKRKLEEFKAAFITYTKRHSYM